MTIEVPILASTVHQRQHWGKTHNLQPFFVTVGLLDQMATEFPDGDWYACLMFSDGHATMRGPDSRSLMPEPDQLDRMFEVSVMLNRELHHDGCWVCVWHDGSMYFLWRDADGDLRFTMDIAEPWVRVRRWEATEITGRCEKAYEQFNEQMRAADLRPENMILRAQGQRPAGFR